MTQCTCPQWAGTHQPECALNVRAYINGVPFDHWTLDQRLARIENLLERLLEQSQK
jgi:hypothetical protein